MVQEEEETMHKTPVWVVVFGLMLIVGLLLAIYFHYVMSHKQSVMCTRVLQQHHRVNHRP